MRLTLATVALAFLAGATAHYWNPYTRAVDHCATVNALDVLPEQVDDLRAHGWTADPTDGAERLYEPGCRR